jgi:dihydroflavonol-4-reductase
MMMKRVFLTGASCYLGAVLLQHLFKHGYQVTALVLKGDNDQLVKKYADVVYGDVRDKHLNDIIKGYDYCLHLASIIDITSGNYQLMKDVNVNGTVNLAEICLKNNVKFIYCSSVHALPVLKSPQVMREINEFSAKKVKGHYSKTKAEASAKVISLRQKGLKAMIGFPSGIIGPSEIKPTNIGTLIKDYLTDELKAYVNGGYNFVDIESVAEGLVLMMKNFKSGADYLLTGEVITISQMMQTISEVSGKEPPRKLAFWFVYLTAYFSELYYYLRRKKPLYTRYSLQTLKSNANFSYEKAEHDLGYQPKSSVESLKAMVKWIMDTKVIKNNEKFVSK